MGPAAKRDRAGLLYLEKESLDRRSGFLELAMSVRTDFAATQYLVDAGAFSEDPFTLIDVGCRGGIHSRWQAFGDNLKAYAIDPLIALLDDNRYQPCAPKSPPQRDSRERNALCIAGLAPICAVPVPK